MLRRKNNGRCACIREVLPIARIGQKTDTASTAILQRTHSIDDNARITLKLRAGQLRQFTQRQRHTASVRWVSGSVAGFLESREHGIGDVDAGTGVDHTLADDEIVFLRLGKIDDGIV